MSSDQLSSFQWAKSDVPPTLTELGIDPSDPVSWPQELLLESFSIPASRFEPDPDRLHPREPRRGQREKAKPRRMAAGGGAGGASAGDGGESLSLYRHLVPYCVQHRRRCRA